MLYAAWVVLHRNRYIGASERRQLIPHVCFQVPFLGPESQLKSGQLRLCGFWRPEGQGGPLSEASFEKFSGPRIGSIGATCFVDDFVSCWGKRGAYPLLLEPS